MNAIRRVVRVGSAYYVAMPKAHMSALGMFAGSFVLVKREGTRIVVETDPELVKKAWEVPTCKPN